MKIKSFIALVALLTLSSCFHLAMIHLTESDREWITWRKQSPRTLLVPNTTNADTIVVVYANFKIKDKNNPFYLSEQGLPPVFEAYGSYRFDFFKSDSLVCHGYFGIKATLKKPSPRFDLTFGRLRTVGDRNEDDLFKRLLVPLKCNSFEVNGRVLDDCIIAGRDVLETDYPNEDVSDQPNLFVISKKYGLVYLRYDNGLSYSIDFSTFDSDNP